MKASITLGIDIGTTGTKVVAFDAADGRLMAVSRSVTAHTNGHGIAEADALEWVDNAISAIADLLTHHHLDARRIAAISTTGMVPAVLVLGDDGMPLRRAILQSDARAVNEIAQVAHHLESFSPVETTGSAVSQQSVAPTLLWLQKHEPEIWSRTRRVVGGYDWVLMHLGGRPHVEQNWALESGLFTIAGERFTHAFSVAQIEHDLVPDIAAPGTVVGELSSAMAKRTGLPAGIPLVVGGADHVLSAYSAGVRTSGDWLIKLGGAGDILVASEKPLVDERLYLDAHPVPGLWLPNGCMATSGSLIRWFQALTGGAELLRLDDEAAAEAAGALYCLPYFLGEKSPLHDPDLRRQGSEPGVYAMLGMAAMMGAVLQAPLAALMALLELTHNPNIILPGMLAVVVSCLTSRQLCRCDGFFISATRQGLHPLQQPLMQALSRVSVPAVMERSLERTPRMVTRERARALLARNPIWILIERSSDDKPTLALKAADLARWLMEAESAPPSDEAGGEGEDAELIDLLEIPGLRLELAPIHLQATLSEAFERLNDQAVDALYVEHGNRPKQKRISGIITRGAIERYYRFSE